MRVSPRQWVPGLALLGLLCAGAVPACSGDKAERQGQLVIAINTDMEIPKDVGAIRIKISTFGRDIYNSLFTVGAGGQSIPATLAISAGSDPNAPVTIRIIGYADTSGQAARVLRKTVTTIPKGRIALLPMPIHFLCDGRLTPAGEDDDGSKLFESDCVNPLDETCSQGTCVPTVIDVASLAEYSPTQVFGGASGPGGTGVCLDVAACFEDHELVMIDNESDCSFPAPPGLVGSGGDSEPTSPATPGDADGTANGGGLDPGGSGSASGPSVDAGAPFGGESAATVEGFNVGLLTNGSGVCNSFGCFVPLDQMELAASPASGWYLENGRIKLPPGVCSSLNAGAISAVVISRACASKTAAIPTCGPWSSVGGDGGGTPPKADAGSSDDAGAIMPGALGSPCSIAEDCTPGLICVNDTTLGQMGAAFPASGLCTQPCDADKTQCDKLQPGSVCFDVTPGMHGDAFCIQGCSGLPDDGCSGRRADMACDVVIDEATQQERTACVPVCGTDGPCGQGYTCNQRLGLCTQSPPNPSPLGIPCEPGSPGACMNGECLKPKDAPGVTICTARCVIQDPNTDPIAAASSCGYDPFDPSPPYVAGCFEKNPTSPMLNYPGAAGLCSAVCDCGSPCPAGQPCYAFDREEVAMAFKAKGYCAFAPNPLYGGTEFDFQQCQLP